MRFPNNFFFVIYTLLISNAVLSMNALLIKGPTLYNQSILSRPSFSSDGTKIATLYNNKKRGEPDIFCVVSTKTGEIEHSFEADDALCSGHFNQVSPEVFLHVYERKNFMNKMQILRYPSLDTVMSEENKCCHEVPSNTTWSPDGKLRLVHYTFKDKMWDVQENRELYTLESEQSFKKFSPDGTKIILARPNLQIRDARTNALIAAIGDVHLSDEVAINNDGSRIATSRDSVALVYETTAPYKKLFTLNGHFATILQLEFSPDGKRILTGSDDGTVILWDAETGKIINSIEHRGRITCATFNSKRPLLLSLGHDVAKISDAYTGNLLYEISADNHEINYVGIVNEFVSEAVFSPDGNNVLTGIFNFSAGTITSTLWTIPDFEPPLL